MVELTIYVQVQFIKYSDSFSCFKPGGALVGFFIMDFDGFCLEEKLKQFLYPIVKFFQIKKMKPMLQDYQGN